MLNGRLSDLDYYYNLISSHSLDILEIHIKCPRCSEAP